jgi:hypothetical protein
MTRPKNQVRKANGRPRGRGEGQNIASRLRKEIYGALDICKKNGQPLDMLLSKQIQLDAAGTLSKLSKFVPQEVNINGEGSEFSLALGEVAARIAEQNAILRHAPLQEASEDAQLIDITPEKPEESSDLPGKASKK